MSNAREQEPVPSGEPGASDPLRAPADWLRGGGELGELIRVTDWSSTPLGPREHWPQSLRTAVGLVVEGKAPKILHWGPELRLLYNDACREILGGGHPRILGRPTREVWPQIWHVVEPLLSAVMGRGEAVFREDEHFSIDRHGRREDAFFTLAATPVRVEDGRIGGVMVELQETTVPRARAQLLRESEARFRAVIDSSRDGINLLDLATRRYVLMSPAQVALTGFSAEELNDLPGAEALARVHPDDRHVSLEQLRRIAAGEDPGGTPVEYRWKVKSGEYRWFSDSRALVRDEHDRPTALVGISRDITERRRTEDALRASQQMYAAIFESSPFALALSTVADGVLVAVNDTFLQMFELARDEVIGKTSLDLQLADAASREEVGAELRARGVVCDFKCVRSTKTGRRLHLSLDLNTVSIGGVPHVLTTIQDVTARTEAEAARQLAQKLQALDELRTRFFSSLSHELRTPLALVLGPTEHLLQALDTPNAIRRDLTVVHRNARTLLGLVDNLLDIAKLEAGRMTAAYADADLAELARVVASNFEVLAEEQRIAFEIEGPRRLPAQIDPEQVQRILLNLLSNAFKFTPAGGRVRLALREPPDRVLIEVADSGPGIPADQREAVFERFGQLASGDTRLGGTGLGLAIARELALLHGGSISISEAPEGGALFAVELPRAAPPGTVVRAAATAQVERQTVARLAAEELRARRASAAPLTAAGGAALVLVVEDHPAMNRFIATSLAGEYRVAVAFDGKEGLEKARALRPDLILCDLMMPEMNGEELVLAARSCPDLDATPIVVLSAKADDELRVRLLREGAQDYLTKPFPVEELRARVGNLVARKLAEQATRHAEARFRGIVTIAADAIISIDARRTITEWNHGAEKIFGYSRAEAIGLPVESLIPERYRAAHHDQVARFAAEAGEARTMDHRGSVGLRKDGEEFPISATISKLEVEGERIMTIAVRDISAQKRIETEQRVLAEVGGALASLEHTAPLQELARIVADSLADFAAVFVAEDDGALYRSAAASRDPAKAWAASLMMELPPSPDPAHPVWQVFGRQSPLLAELDPERYEAIARGPEDLRALRTAEPRCALLVPLIAAGKCVGVLCLASTAHRFDERDLQLAQEVARRCALFVENARLHRAEKRAVQVRDEVLGIVAHDLRNPLNAIVLQAALLRHPAAQADRFAKHAGMIERNAARMNRIIEDLLDVAQLEVGQLRLARARVSAAALLAEIVEAQGESAASRSVQLRSDAADDLPEIWADRDRLVQVFENLIGNALKFTLRGTISIGARPSGGEVLFWVADTGAGIAAQDVPHLFDRFWQAHRPARGGAGLGLTIVKGIVEGQGGRVWVESQLGAGSTFFFTVPIAPAQAAVAADAADPGEDRRRDRVVLVAEDREREPRRDPSIA